MKTTLFLVFSRISMGLFTLSIAIMLTIAFVPEGFAQRQETAQPAQTTIAKLKMQAVCDTSKITSSSRGRTTTYTCTGGDPVPAPATSIQMTPMVQRSDISCTYTESGGKTTWTGCNCTANDDSDCTTFITNCVSEGDTVNGNAGSASCKP